MSAGASIDPVSDPARAIHARVSEPVPPVASPGVAIPAPLYFAATITLAWPLHLAAPLTIVHGRLADAIGALVCLAVAVVSARAMLALVRAGTAIRPDRPARALVTEGPFGWSRNPIYLSLAVLVAGLGVWTRNGWMLVLLPPTLWLVTRIVIAREERYLLDRFGERYRAYRDDVPRWV